MKLEGKVALITGAATGIGRATAILFAQEGAKVVIADINDKEGNKTVEMIREAGSEAIFTHVDVAKVSELERMVKTGVQTYGRLDIFHHNAGIAGPGGLENVTEEAFDRIIAINLKAGFFGAKYAVPELRKAGGGCILFTSSGLGLRPSPQAPAYSVTKAGIVMLTRALASALAEYNIRVNAICPGPILSTPLFQDVLLWAPGTVPDELARLMVENRMIKRPGTVEEIAAAALFLVSPESSYITGVALPVDGGGAAK